MYGFGPQFRDRAQAGRELARHLTRWANREDVLVLALPRGGVPVAAEIADLLHAPLDVCVVRKVGVPGYPEFAMGAVAAGGVRVLNDEMLGVLGLSEAAFERIAQPERREVQRRELAYRQDRAPLRIADRVVILVDDGIATGSTLLAATRVIRAQGPRHLVIAVPVAPAAARVRMERAADEFICLHEPETFFAISMHYGDFPQVADDEVRRLLHRAAAPQVAGVGGSSGSGG